MLKAQFYKRLKDSVKDKMAYAERLSTLQRIITTAIRINNCLYKRLLKHKRQYLQRYAKKGLKQKSQQPKPIEIDLARHQGPCLSKEELKRRCKNKLCFKCRKEGHMLSFHCQGQRGPPKGRKKGQLQGKQLHAAMQINIVNSKEQYLPNKSAQESVRLASLDNDNQTKVKGKGKDPTP